MARSKRVLFTFDPRNYNNLRELTDSGRFPTVSEAVRDALQVARALQKQALQGYTEVVVRNPETRQERVIVLPSLGLQTPSERPPGDEPQEFDLGPALDTGRD